LYEEAVANEVEKRIASAFPHLKEKQKRADKMAASYTPKFSKKQCQDVARCLHPDAWQSLNLPSELVSRLEKAFIIFTEMQNFLHVK
jgi:hypothetical protein